MNKTAPPLITDLIFSSVRVFLQPKDIALRIKNNELSWTRTLLIYSLLLIISIIITNSALEPYTNNTFLQNIKTAVYLTVHSVIFSFVIRYTLFLFKGTLSNEKTLKLYLIYSGVTNIIYSLSIISQLSLFLTQNISLVLFIAFFGLIWIVLSYWATVTVNDIQGKIKKIAILLLLMGLTFLFSYMTSMITNVQW